MYFLRESFREIAKTKIALQLRQIQVGVILGAAVTYI